MKKSLIERLVGWVSIDHSVNEDGVLPDVNFKSF